MTSEEAAATPQPTTLLKGLFSDICKPKYLERLSEIMTEAPATVISTTYCPYCTKAKKLLESNEVKYQEIMLDEIYGQD